jgi:pyruvate dehydrogenase E1 component beta subunit
MAELITYREAVAEGIAREMRRDPTVVCLGEDIGAAEGVFKTTVGLFTEFGPQRVWDTPISEQAIVGAALGAAMTGIRPVAEIMFSDFLACCWDYVANEIPKMRYMTGGQVTVPLVVRTANGGGLGFGAQHSQAVENWAFAVPGLKVVAPATPSDVIGLMASSIRSDDPVIFFEHKGLYRRVKEDLPEEEYTVPIGKARVFRPGNHLSIITYGAMVYVANDAADQLAKEGISVEIVDLRTVLPIDEETVLASVRKTSKAILLHEDVMTGGVGGEIAARIAERAFEYLDGPVVRIAPPDTPIPFSPPLEDAFLPSAAKVVEKARWLYRY